MTHRSISILTAILLSVAFCAFVMVYERFAMNRAQDRIETHARIIEDAMWNYNRQGIDEYLKLAAFSDRYESLTVVHRNGETFHEIYQEPSRSIERMLISFHLIPKVRLRATVSHRGETIGHVEAVWLPRTIYTYANVFLALVSLFVIIQLQLRLLRSKTKLEERVMERTAELVASNMELKREIDERTRAEEALRTSEMKYRFLSENINDVIWSLDMDLNYTYISPAATRIHGWDAAYRGRLTLDKALTPASLRKASDLIGKHLAQGEKTGDYRTTITAELEVINKDGSNTICEVTASFILDENNQPTGLLGVSRDITERRKAEAEKAELQRKLERSKKMESLGLLAGGVAHDLNNVLSGIVSYPDLLLMDLPEVSPMRAPIETIKASGQKAATIVQDLLTLARRGVKTSEILNINDLIRQLQQAAEYNELLSLYPDVQFSFDLASDLPNIKGSAVHLTKTFMNLLANAAEAQPGGGEIHVATQSLYLDRPIKGYNTVEPGEYIRLQVKDSGEGISETDINHIFEPFYTKKEMGRSGTGLGLAVVWGAVRDHRGYIDVHSQSGKGTTFHLYFPLSRESAKEKTASLNLENIQGNGERVLVVDDLESQRTIATHLLQRLNYSAHAVNSGEAAVEYLQDNTVDLVVLDMIMDPGMDGLETWRQIVGIHPEQRAIIASGYAETEKVKTAQRLGAGEYLKKPYMIDSLGKSIKKALAGSDET
ncbi:histidine kinase [Desulfosarcina widdelii]|uniref:histidine kinase n=1 Tax=Desulfosarcina widdelii TaxID=947919 RepID=A0A5K7Z0A4_9BACT|nr:ATP-binding protein [Desulfosarcina widdelii]BBO75402.1 histidine kinase [Desulfosarcina widdelii]